MSEGMDSGGAVGVQQPASTAAGAAVQAATYTGIVFLLSAPFWIGFKSGHAMTVPAVMLLMWCPAVSAIASTLIFKKPLVGTWDCDGADGGMRRWDIFCRLFTG